MAPHIPRHTNPRRWRNLLLAGAAVGTAAAGLSQTDPALANDFGQVKLWLAAGEGGEGGESGVTTELDAGVDLLKDLGKIEGKLRAGIAAFRQGHLDMATPHMVHADDAVYVEVSEHLEERGLSGFADQLTTLTNAVNGNASATDADAAFDGVVGRITELRATLGLAPHQVMEAIELLVRDAAEDYEVGVTDGAVTDLHEYQDAWGYIQASRRMAEALFTSNDARVLKAAQTALDAITDTDEVFAGVTPEGSLPDGADVIYGAAARIEFSALALK